MAYDMFRLDRNRHGGGVMLYCRSELRGKRLTPLHDDKIEMLWVELILGSAKIIFGVCYRPPNQNAICRTAFFDGLSNTFDLLQSKFKKKPFILVGDFNDRCHAWDDDHRNSELGLELVNLINSFYLTQMINQVTREESLLDLIITNCPNYFETFGVADPINDLDHCPIHGQIRLTYPKKANYQRTIFKYTAEHLSKLNNNLKDVPWNVMLSHNDTIDDMVVNFTSIVKDEMKECIPNKTVLIRPNDKPGMTGRIRYLFRKCNRLHKIASKSKLPQDIEKHRTARKEAKYEWKIAKQNYYNRLYNKMSTSENKNKVYWKITKSLYGQNKIPNIPTLTLNGTDYTDEESKATILNEYFVSQTRLTNPFNWNLTYDIADDTNSPTLNTVAINPDDIMKCLTRSKYG